MQKIKYSFDIGGCISKYPQIFRPLIKALLNSDEAEVYIITDIHDRGKSIDLVHNNGFDIPDDHILNSDFSKYGGFCKAVLLKEYKIDFHVDDFPDYIAEGCPCRLFVMPNPREPYFHDDWITDNSEGDFGRRKHVILDESW